MFHKCWTDCNGHASLSAVSHVRPCVRVRARSCVSDTVFCCLGLSVLGRGCCSSLGFLPWPAYEKAAVLITWSSGLQIRHTLLSWHLLITRSFFRNSFLDFIPAPLCSLLRRNELWRSLFIWLNVAKRTYSCAPFTKRCCGTMLAFHRERDEINMSGGDTCNAAMSEQHTASLQRGQHRCNARAQKCYSDIKYQESRLCAETGAPERSFGVIKHWVLPRACWEILCTVHWKWQGPVCTRALVNSFNI